MSSTHDVSRESVGPPTGDPASPGSGALRPGRPEAAAAIWDWESVPPEADAAATLASSKRVRGVIQASVAAALGAALLWFGVRTPAFVVFAVASVVALSALVAPTSLYAGIERGLAALGRLTGQALGWVLLTPVFYLFFAPFGALLRRGRRDRLQRALDPEAASYWEPHEGMRTASDSYLRQF